MLFFKIYLDFRSKLKIQLNVTCGQLLNGY